MVKFCVADWLHVPIETPVEDTLSALRCVSETMFAPDPLFWSTVANCVPDVVAPARVSSSFRSRLFVPETLVCVTLHSWVTPDVEPASLHDAVLFPVVEVWTITHLFGAAVPPDAGVHEKLLALAAPVRAAICRTRVAVVQLHPGPGQFGPA